MMLSSDWRKRIISYYGRRVRREFNVQQPAISFLTFAQTANPAEGRFNKVQIREAVQFLPQSMVLVPAGVIPGV